MLCVGLCSLIFLYPAQLLLTFEPFMCVSQEYLVGFCDDFFSNEFAAKTSEEYVCPINAFDSWLKNQSASKSPSGAYLSSCVGASELPMPPESFDPCMIAWSQVANETLVLQRAGKVKILVNRFQSRVRYDSPFDDLNNEWNAIESWMTNQTVFAPPGVNGMFFSSEDFW
jgi:hypothetical protein